MVSAQQTNLLPKNASRNNAIFAQKVYRIYATTSQYLSSYGCTITMVYIIILYTEKLAMTYISAPALIHSLTHTNIKNLIYIQSKVVHFNLH